MNPSIVPFSVGARVAGAIIASGYLVGVVPGSVVAVVGALALITFGRAVGAARADAVWACAVLALFAAATGVGALRFGTLDLGALRGAQAVLGPTVLLGPPVVSAATWIAAGAGMLALAGWLVAPPSVGIRARAWWGVEATVAAFALVTVFWGRAVPGTVAAIGRTAGDVGGWVAVTAAATVVAVATGLLLERMPRPWRVSAVTFAGLAVATAGGLLVAAA